jgi:transposase
MTKILHDNTNKKIRVFQLKGAIMPGEYITEAAWAKMFCFLKTVKNIYVGQERECKNFLEAIYWIARSGAPWRILPLEYGGWNSIFKRFNAWSKKRIWENLHSFCIQDPDTEYIMIDATIVRAHACSAGYGEQQIEGLGRTLQQRFMLLLMHLVTR